MADGLRVRDLTVSAARRELVQGISFDVAPGERVALIGESGSGKTLTAQAIMGLLAANLTASGSITLDGSPNLITLREAHMARFRREHLAMVFQEPLTALDPLMRVGKQLKYAFGDASGDLSPTTTTPLDAGVPAASGAQRARRGDRATTARLAQRARRGVMANALSQVGLPASAARAYPHQLSGGQRQRVLIAMALARQPQLLIADEPTTALDASVQAQILELLGELVERSGAGLLFISHDLSVVAQVADRALVMQGGRVVESGPVADMLRAPQHPYTQALLAATRLDAVQAAEAKIADPTPARTRFAPFAPGAPGRARNDKISGAGGQIVAPKFAEAKIAGQARNDNLGWVRVEDLVKDYQRSGGFGRAGAVVHAVRGVSFEARPLTRLGIVGESGSGKSTTLNILAGLEVPTSGFVQVTGTRQIVSQDPYSTFDPRWPIGRSIAEPLLALSKSPFRTTRVRQVTSTIDANRVTTDASQPGGTGRDRQVTPWRLVAGADSKAGRAALVREALADVALDPGLASAYPHQLSGGQRQRAAIARALIARPDVLLADEPVSALDVTTRAEILRLLAAAADGRFTLVMVSHDLQAIRYLCDRVVVMRDGIVVEKGETETVWANPQHPYTQMLKAASPELGAG